jgi:hypothetical protein
LFQAFPLKIEQCSITSRQDYNLRLFTLNQIFSFLKKGRQNAAANFPGKIPRRGGISKHPVLKKTTELLILSKYATAVPGI